MVDRIDRSLAEVTTSIRQNPQLALFELLWVQILRSAWVIREEIMYAALRVRKLRVRAGTAPSSETFSAFVREVGKKCYTQF